MAAILFNAGHRKLRIREQLETVLAAVREALDALIGSRMQPAVAQDGHIRPRRPHGTHSIEAH